MATTRLSSRGHVAIPKGVRSAHGWKTGLELQVVDVAEGILLKPASPFPETRLEDVVGCVGYKGPRKSLAEMEEGIAKGARESR